MRVVLLFVMMLGGVAVAVGRDAHHGDVWLILAQNHTGASEDIRLDIVSLEERHADRAPIRQVVWVRPDGYHFRRCEKQFGQRGARRRHPHASA